MVESEKSFLIYNVLIVPLSSAGNKVLMCFFKRTNFVFACLYFRLVLYSTSSRGECSSFIFPQHRTAFSKTFVQPTFKLYLMMLILLSAQNLRQLYICLYYPLTSFYTS